MGQKVHPLGFRVGISRNHSSVWYSNPKKYSLSLKEDSFIRNFVKKNLAGTFISEIDIKRKLNFLTVDIYVIKPGAVLGTNGSKLFELKNKLSSSLAKDFVSYDLTINVLEITNPDSNSRVLSDFIRQQLESRVPFRRVMKAAILKAQKAGVKGIKVQISGRLNGAEIARTEWAREGQVPLHTLRANIDYFNSTALVNRFLVIFFGFYDFLIFLSFILSLVEF